MTRAVGSAAPLARLGSAGRVSSGFGHLGPGPYTDRAGFVTESGVVRPGSPCLGIDVGATMTRFQLGVTGPAGPHPVLKIRYLTGDAPQDLLEQVAEVASFSCLLGLGALRCVRVGVAGPVYRGAIELTNKPRWLLTDWVTRLRKHAGCADVEVTNDMTVGMRWLPEGPWRGLISPLRPARDPGRFSTGRRLKCQIGTGLNISLMCADGTVEPLEYGHQPFPQLTPLDQDLAHALTRLHGRHVITCEDFLGGRGFGPVLLAHAALARPQARAGLPPKLRTLLDNAAPDPPRGAVVDEELVRAIAGFDVQIKELAARFTGQAEPPLLDSYARYALWLLTDFLQTGQWPVFEQVLADYGRRLALFVASAVQITMCDEVYLGGKLVFEPVVREGFVTSYPRLAGQFAHARRLTGHVAVHAFDEPEYEVFLFQTAAHSVAGP